MENTHKPGKQKLGTKKNHTVKWYSVEVQKWIPYQYLSIKDHLKNLETKKFFQEFLGYKAIISHSKNMKHIKKIFVQYLATLLKERDTICSKYKNLLELPIYDEISTFVQTFDFFSIICSKDENFARVFYLRNLEIKSFEVALKLIQEKKFLLKILIQIYRNKKQNQNIFFYSKKPSVTFLPN